MLISPHPRFCDERTFANWFAFFSKSQIQSAKLANQIQIKFIKIQIWKEWFVSNIRVKKFLNLVICATALVIPGQISLTTVCKSLLVPSIVECPSVVNPIHLFLKMSWVKPRINKLDKRQAFLYDTSLRAPTLLRWIVAPCYYNHSSGDGGDNKVQQIHATKSGPFD